MALTKLTRKISAVHRGIAFEQRALSLLRDNFSMSLKRVGGRGDGGIDLLGWWWLPPTASPNPNPPASHPAPRLTRRIRIIGQCKAEKKLIGPNYVRELEGVMCRFTAAAGILHHDDRPHSSSGTGRFSGDRDEPTVAILISQSPFTKATHLRAQSSPIPFLLIHLPVYNPSEIDPDPEEITEAAGMSGRAISSAVWNMALGGTQGVLQGQMEVRWERDLSSGVGKPGVWWQGRKLSSCIPEGS